MTDSERLAIIREVFTRIFDETESLLNETGGNLAYLLAAIAGSQGDKPAVELMSDDEFLGMLQKLFPADHRVWDFVIVEVATDY